MLSKRIDQITLQDLEDLVNTHQSENQRLEFKQEISISTSQDKKEFLRDLTALANTQGGYYIIGMEEDKGEAIALTGIELPDPDKYKLQLEQVIRDNLEPRILGLQIRHFELITGRFAVVIFVPRSSFPPHRMQNDTFFERSNTGKYPLNMDQIRRVFTRSASLREEIRNFVRERQELVCTRRDGDVQFKQKAVVMVHLIPFEAIESELSIPINSEFQYFLWNELKPFGGGFGTANFNADGLICNYFSSKNNTNSYTQLFRNGIFEGASDSLIKIIDEKIRILPGEFEISVITWLHGILKIARKLEISPPLLISITLQNIRDASFYLNFSIPGIAKPRKIGKDILYLPSITIEDIDEFNFREENQENEGRILAKKMQPAFDVLWQACGYSKSHTFDRGNIWNPFLDVR